MERIAKKRHLPFLTSYAKAKQKYAIDTKKDDFVEMAYDVWRSIGNIAPSIYVYYTKVPDDGIVELPTEVEFIQSVTSIGQIPRMETYDSGGEKERHVPGVSIDSAIPEKNQSVTTSKGSSVNYMVLDNNTIRITSELLTNDDLMIVYRALDLDDDGLPLLNDKEVEAIAAETARRLFVRKVFQGSGPSANNALVSMLQILTQDAERLMAAAKIDEKINDDALDKMMDIKTSWDRKVYGSRFNFMH